MTFSKLGTDTETNQPVYLPKPARTQGLYIIGIQGTGKSGLIENLIMQDIDQQIGVCVLDPHGELIEHVIARLPGKAEEDKVIFLDLADYKHPFGLNLLACPDPTDDGEIVKTLYQVLHVFEKAYGIVPTTPLMYDLLYNTVYMLIANPGYTMIDIRLLLTNEACRKKLAANVPNDDIKDFWTIWDDPKQTTLQERENKRGTILNKMNEFSHVPLRNIVGQSTTSFDLEDMMNTGKILLVKLSRRLEQPSNLIGSIIVAQLLNAAYARPVNKRKQFHLYADEFQNFATEDFATLLEEARKFGIATTLAHQNRGQLSSANSQLETDLKDRSRSVGNMVVFKINSKDADDLAGEFDTTPPPPIPEEKTRRAIQTPVLEPIQYMVSHGVHPLVHTRTFVEAYGKQLMDGARKEEQEERDNKLQWDRYLSQSPTMGSRMLMPSVSVSSIFRSTLDGLNQLFYQAMLAGKRGEDVDAIGIPAVILNNMIHLFQIGGANQFQELHKLYHYYLAQLKITVIDNDERTKELQDTLADLSHYVQDKVTSLHSELNTAASNLRHVLRRALAEEAAQARARMLIVWNGKCKRFVNVRPPEKSGSLGELYPNSLIGGILGGRYAEGSNYTVGNLSYTQEGQLFKTWEEVVHFYIDLYRPCWFRIDAAIMLNRNNWQQTTRSVYWTEWHDKYKSPKTNDYWDAYELFLETWEPKQGIERMWYTQAMLEAEIERRVSDAYHGIVNRSSAQSALESYVPFALQQEVGKEEMDIHSNQHKLTTIVSVATAEMEEQKKKIEYELEQLNKLAAAKPVYDAVVAQLTSELREILRELASPAGRVEGDSGIQEVVMGHGIQLSSAEMEARISNQLVSLPMSRFEKLALVKIAENIPQNPGKKCVSCGVVNNPGVLYCVQCQTRIIGANEYTIKTIKPPDVNTQLLEQRVKRILANNLRSGNVRERSTVEAEILQRQSSCSSGAAPVQQPQQPSPQQPRHARQVPVPGQCPNCNATIPRGSQFCNRCGMKLT